jgi:transposase
MENIVKTPEKWDEIIAEKDDRITKLGTRVTELETLVDWYERQLRLAKHRQYGAKSEKSEYDQLTIFNEVEATADEETPEPELKEVARHFRKRKRLVNDTLPENLPIEIVVHDLEPNEKECPQCGGDMHEMTTEKRRELVIIPAKVKIREHVRKVYACRACEKNEISVPIEKAPIDEPVIKGSFASPEAVAHIIHQKFVMHSPLYRQEQDWTRQGIPLSRQTMSNWLIKATEDWLAPIYSTLYAMILSQTVLFADETTLQVLHEPGKPPQSKSYMWLYRTGSDATMQIVLYEYQPNRKAEHPAKFLKNFKGYLHADGYEGYHSLPNEITVVGCLAHARRKFDEALKSLKPENRANSNIAQGKKYCDKLFELERDFSELSLTPQERFEQRQKLSKPLLSEFFAWAEKHSHLTKTPLGGATNYLLNQREYLELYLLDGRLEISNNRAERSIKPFVIGRKNFLFANTPRGAKTSAVIFSIVETAKENGLNPYKYLTYIFKNAPNWDVKNNQDKIQLLLPNNIPDNVKSKMLI